MLDKYLETIKIAGIPLREGYQGYRMDGTTPERNMRKDAGLGTCNCCDYFIIGQDASTILIEETRLIDQIRRLNDEYDYLSDRNRDKFIRKYIQSENKLKVYGSMLVLCHLKAVCEGAKTRSEERKYDFWLVAGGMDKPEDAILFDSIRDGLFEDLRGVLTGKIVGDVKVIPSVNLAAKLSEYTSNS